MMEEVVDLDVWWLNLELLPPQSSRTREGSDWRRKVMGEGGVTYQKP